VIEIIETEGKVIEITGTERITMKGIAEIIVINIIEIEIEMEGTTTEIDHLIMELIIINVIIILVLEEIFLWDSFKRLNRFCKLLK